jgi:hypothetical protein
MRSDGERSLGNRGTRRCEIRSGAAPAVPSSSAPECANNDLAPRVRGQSKPIKTTAYGLVFAPKIGHFASNFKALWAVWFGNFNSRLCAVWGPSLDRRTLRDGETPPCPSHRQALSRLDNARRTGCSRTFPDLRPAYEIGNSRSAGLSRRRLRVIGMRGSVKPSAVANIRCDSQLRPARGCATRQSPRRIALR